MTTDQATTTAGTLCPETDHTGCSHPEGATLYLGGTAWAHPALTDSLVPVTDLTPYPGNPRRGDQDAITASVRDLGIYKAQITYQTSTGHVLTGNHTLRALLDLDAELAPATAVDVSDTRGAAIVARDNRTSDLGVYDDAELLALLTADEEVLAVSGYADAPGELLLMQRRAEAEDVFIVGADHMLDEFREISGTEPAAYAQEYARKMVIYLRDQDAIDDFRARLGITAPLGPNLNYPLGWVPDDRRKPPPAPDGDGTAVVEGGEPTGE